GRVALVTGAGGAGGIGFATARVLRAAGARVAITSTTERIFDRARALGPDVFATMADLRRPEEVARLVAETEAALGPVEILVNNAGGSRASRFPAGISPRSTRPPGPTASRST
ncbi:MAG: SDR family NAD(P)-dependent oxidoreductase, partial [Albidovulum sp.]